MEKTHTAPSNYENLYKCTQCTSVFRKIATLNTHITKSHTLEKSIDEIEALREQLKKVEGLYGNQSKQICISSNEGNDNNCKQEKSQVSVSNTFIKLADGTIDGSLRRYIVKVRREGDVRWLICPYCSKEIKKPSDLVRHIRIHTREKPYKVSL